VNDSTLKLYQSSDSPNSRRVRIFLAGAPVTRPTNLVARIDRLLAATCSRCCSAAIAVGVPTPPNVCSERQSCRWHVAVDILLAVRPLVVQGGSTALEQITKKPGFFC
jgi:hypothetical protein